ncbi:hypothetical protein CDAR_99821 [Caerostris darwini]|uniref:Uncharacterized protein n=1 Tax=Caerostris darwini TaxID=1538125 RepID=A0AAV4X086_9ARAC|nr:hypothetical protein CDAR_99821 [Caerostris darwini]
MDNFLEACASTAAVNYKTSSRRKRHGVSWQPFSAQAPTSTKENGDTSRDKKPYLTFNQAFNLPQTRAWIIFWKPALLQLIIKLLLEENAAESHGSLFLHKLYIKEPGKFHLQEDKDLDGIVCNRLLREKGSRLLTRVHTFSRWK